MDMDEAAKWKARFERERASKKAAEELLENKSRELYDLNESLKKLVKSEENQKKYLDTVIESNQNAIIAVDKNQTILTYNKRAEEIFGFSKAEMLGTQNLISIVPEPVRQSHKNAAENYFQTFRSKGIIGNTIETEAMKKDGSLIPVRLSFGTNENSENMIVVANIEDISKEKEQERTILQQSRLAQMGEMISMIAHQWRQPLSAISAVSNGLAIKNTLNKYDKEEFEKNIRLISEHAQHLSKTIDDFRNFFKETKEKGKTTFTTIVNCTLTIVKHTLDSKGIEVELDLNSEEEFLTLANEVKQVVLNLVKNAEDVLLERHIDNPKIKISTYKKEDKQMLCLKDNAGGIPEDVIDYIFDPYFSTKKEKDGTGLGLYMSKIIIEEHCGGRLWADNDENGAVFTIEF
jgi:PAS domain S-box-containing protein